ncbi:Transposase DDE domain protein [Piscirickettsia salmonis]|nr:transposase [Piscirickettsia salmonis]QGP54539.1 Transposase DDE domain protein [Piscirickettsia salmonis]QGP59580.1 Transposase DDE domain protein [Piscirickettsia salmonis]QGP64262.1 Transposase DDE domain protein [Piscirickettsia salmonis]
MSAITRLLNKTPQTSKDLWLKIKADVREYEGLDDGVLALDDMIAEKPYSDENDIIAWHYDHSKGRTVKGINILTAMVRYGDVRLPIAYEVIEKTIRYSDLQTKKERRKSSFTKNDLFLKLLNVAIRNDLKFAYVLADRWFSSQSNMSYIHNVGKKFIMGIKSNRCVALTEKDKENGKYQQLKQISLEDGIPQTVYLKGMAFKVQVMKKTFKNENGKESVLYLVTNDLSNKFAQNSIYLSSQQATRYFGKLPLRVVMRFVFFRSKLRGIRPLAIDGQPILDTYKKRWSIEEFHKSVKQNSSFEKSPTRIVTSQLNHIYYSILGFCRLERLKLKKSLNHFAIKYKLILRANQIALQELRSMV